MTLEELNGKLAKNHPTLRRNAVQKGDHVLLIADMFFDEHLATVALYCLVNNMYYVIEADEDEKVRITLRPNGPPT